MLKKLLVITLSIYTLIGFSFAQKKDTTKNIIIYGAKDTLVNKSKTDIDSTKLNEVIRYGSIEEAEKNDSLPDNISEPMLVDEIAAIVGNRMILLSDIHSQQAIWKQGRGINPNAKLSDKEKLQIFEDMLIQKLLAVSAVSDSLPSNEVGVVGMVEQRITQMTEQLGSVAEVEKMFKSPIYQIREMLTYQAVEEDLANAMRQEITTDKSITPLEVKRFAQRFAKDSVEIIPRSISYAEIAILPPSDYEAKMAVKESLLELRKRITQGESFSAIARIYSEDRTTAMRGGDLDYMPLSSFEAEFADAAKTLTIGDISGIVETAYGFHILQLIDIKNGQYRLKHILRRTTLDADDIANSLNKLDSIAVEIRRDSISFSDAALKYSQDESSKKNDGILLNARQAGYAGARGQTPKFKEDEIGYDADVVLGLKVGEVSDAFVTYNYKGEQICKIVKLIADYPAHRANIKDDYTYFEDLAIAEQQEESYKKWIADKIKATYVKINAPYNKSKFEFNWTKK